ncbi:MipA/OmpV family protein [Marinomonas sp.]|nr:MipA/OmpV family protein [Marinomonas sp.]MDB4837449.1 MipA/OmpV family protein [Marinomonas sp.]
MRSDMYRRFSIYRLRLPKLTLCSLTLAAYAFFSSQVMAEESSLTLGATGLYYGSPYKGIDEDTGVYPLILRKSPTWFTGGRSIGYHLTDFFDVSVAYQGSFLDPDDSSDANISQLEERKAGPLLQGTLNIRPLKVEIGQGLSSSYDEGYYINASLGLPVYRGSFIAIAAVDYRYNSEKRSNYLYSVSADESSLTSGALDSYSLDSGTSVVRYAVRLIQPLSDVFRVSAVLSHSRYDDDITDSPLVGKSSTNAFILSASYTFPF